MIRISLTLPGAVAPQDAARLAAHAEQAGCEALWTLDVRRDPYVLAAAAVSATSTIEVGTAVAVAFSRSPAATAAAAWDLAMWSRGRFVLGLGSQVGPTLEARFGVQASHPAPRMREYVTAVRACFEAQRRGYGGHRGRFYTIRRPVLQPGPEPMAAQPPIYMAAVNPLMTQMAGEVGDGLAAHPFTTPSYLREVVLPALAAGAERAGRPRPPVLLGVVVAPSREVAAAQMMAYTVPAYRRVLEHQGCGEVGDEVVRAVGEGRRGAARALIDQTFLDDLAVIVGDDIETGLRRWEGLADRIALSVPWLGAPHADQMRLFEQLLGRVERMSR